MNLLLDLLSIAGVRVAALPGAGFDWLLGKLGVEQRDDSTASKFTWGMNIFTWAGPVYLISQLLVIALYASGVTVLTGQFIYWFPGAETTLQVLAVIWLWMGIGFTGLIAYWILLWVLKIWLGTLGVFGQSWGYFFNNQV